MASNLGTRTRYVNIVIRKKDIKISILDNKLKEFLETNCELYFYIYHKNDLQPRTYEVEDEHCHIVATMKKVQRLSTILGNLCEFLRINTLGVQIEKLTNLEGSVQYLLHKNDKDKTQHNKNEIVTNCNLSELDTILESDNSALTYDYVFNICVKSHNLCEVISLIGFARYNQYRNTIRDIWQNCKTYFTDDLR